MFGSQKELVKLLKEEGTVISDEVFTVMSTVDRKHFSYDRSPYFLYSRDSKIEGDNSPSSPRLHATVLELAFEKLRYGAYVMEISNSTGYMSVCFAKAVGDSGRVILLSTSETSRENAHDNIVTNYRDLISRICIEEGCLSIGKPLLQPYDIIYLADKNWERGIVPQCLLDQLANGGRLLMAYGFGYNKMLLKVDKTSNGKIIRKFYDFGTEYKLLTPIRNEQSETNTDRRTPSRSDTSFQQILQKLNQLDGKIEEGCKNMKKDHQQLNERIENIEGCMKIELNKINRKLQSMEKTLTDLTKMTVKGGTNKLPN